jgi:hypothetical protein
VYVVVFGVGGDSSLPFDAGIKIMSQSITPLPVPQPQQEEPVAEEVAATTDPKTHAKIKVTQAIRNATMADFDGNNFVIKGKTYTFKTNGASVPALRSFCHKNGILMDDGKSLQTATRVNSKKQSRTNIDASMLAKKITGCTDNGKATLSNASVTSKEACSTRGAPLKKDDLIISTHDSKAGDKDFYEAAMKEYNKEKHDEYETAMKEYNKEDLDEYNALHFADNIVADDKNLPTVFNPIKNLCDLKKVFNETTAELDRIQQQSMLSGCNGSDSEGETDSKTI